MLIAPLALFFVMADGSATAEPPVTPAPPTTASTTAPVSPTIVISPDTLAQAAQGPAPECGVRAALPCEGVYRFRRSTNFVRP